MFGINSNYKYLVFQLSVIGLCILCSLVFKPLIFVVFAISVYTIRSQKDRNAFCQLFFILPFSMIYKLSPASSSFFAYTLLYYAFYLIVHDKVRLDSVILLSVYLLLGSIDSIETWAKLVSGFILLSFFVEHSNQRSIRDCVACFSVGLVMSSLIGFYIQDWPVLLSYYKELNEELIGGEIIARFSGLYGDPNYYSISIIMVAYFLINFLIRNSINKIIFIPVTVILVYWGFLTYSKLYMLSIFFVLATQLRSYFKTAKNKIIVIIFTFFVGAIALDKFLSSEYFVQFSSRVDTDNISTNRFYIWSEYLDYLGHNIYSLLFGVGFSSSFYKGSAPHNTYIECLYFLGVFGTVIYCMTILKIFDLKRLIRIRTIDNYYILFIFLMMIGTLGVMTFNEIWLYFMLIWGALNIDYRHQNCLA